MPGTSEFESQSQCGGSVFPTSSAIFCEQTWAGKSDSRHTARSRMTLSPASRECDTEVFYLKLCGFINDCAQSLLDLADKNRDAVMSQATPIWQPSEPITFVTTFGILNALEPPTSEELKNAWEFSEHLPAWRRFHGFNDLP